MTNDKYFDSLKKLIPAVSRETVADLMAFETLFKKWSKAINLASPNTLNALWGRHILDSAQLYTLGDGAKNWLDLGSGGGFPGVVLAVLLKNNPDSIIRMVESNGKKSAFLRTAVAQFKAPSQVFNCRIEDSYVQISTPDIITARALAPLDKLFSLTEPWMSKGSSALFQKGRDYQREIDESHSNWNFDLLKYDSRVEEGSVILKISNLRRR